MDSIQLANKIKLTAWKMAYTAKASHMGGNFSVADVLAVLYSQVANISKDNVDSKDRDRIVLSKGHCCAVLYAVLAECGFFDREELNNFGKDGTIFSCHASKKVPGVEISTGSLGHGVAMAAGMALNGKINNIKYNVYSICGDGELDEGSVWETIMFAGQHKLDNFTLIVDFNGMQAMGYTKDIISHEQLSKKCELFGWHTIDVDGHNHKEIYDALRENSCGKPKMIVSHTIKGHGVSFMENDLWWHYQIPFGDYYNKAIEELTENLK